jgi:DNA-binding NarL/FixJ family response regulator
MRASPTWDHMYVERETGVAGEAGSGRAEPGAEGVAEGTPAPRARPIRVVIVDDHPLYRQGMSVVVELDPAAAVVGTAGNGREAAEVCARLRPDVCLMDVRMPEVGGIQGCRLVRAAAPGTRILMLTMSDDEGDLLDAMHAGAHGYLLKDLPGEEVSAAILRVHAGEAVVTAGMAAALCDELGVPAVGDGGAPTLSGPQSNVLRLMARGLASADIAGELAMSLDAVRMASRGILEAVHRSALSSMARRPGPGRLVGPDG